MPFPRTPRLAIGMLAAVVALGCDLGVEPYVPGEKPEQPDLSRIFPEGAERAAQNAAPMPGGGGGGQPAGEAPGMPGRGAPPVAGDDASPVAGTITLAPGFERKVPVGAILFLVARKGQGGGPPLAVKRIESPRFPLEFSLGPADRMIQQMPFEGPLQLSARLDTDGNAMTRTPGDLQGTAQGLHQPGDGEIAIVIDQIL